MSHPIQRLEYHGLTHQFLSLVGSFCDVAGILAGLPELRGFRGLCWGRFAAVFYRLTGKSLTSCAQATTRDETIQGDFLARKVGDGLNFELNLQNLVGNYFV